MLRFHRKPQGVRMKSEKLRACMFFICVFAVLLIPVLVQAEEGKTVASSRLYVGTSLFHERIGLPFLNPLFGEGLDPGVSFDAEYLWGSAGRFAFSQSLGVSAVMRKDSMEGNCFELKTAFFTRFRLPVGFFIESSATLGYLHSFAAMPQIRYAGMDGGWKTASESGTPGGVLALGVGAGYDFKKTVFPFRMFVRFEMTSNFTFLEYRNLGLPFYPSFSLKAGISFAVGRKKDGTR